MTRPDLTPRPSLRGGAPVSAPAGITAVPLSDREWRVTDDRLALGDGLAVMAFIEKVGDRFEVTEFADPVRFRFFGTFDAALESLASKRNQEKETAPVVDLATRRRTGHSYPHAM